MGCAGCSFKSTIIDIKDSESFSDQDVVKYTLNTSYDWLGDLPDTSNLSNKVEVSFKNNRKQIYRNTNEIAIKRGDIVSVQADYGYDVGVVSYTGKLAELKFQRQKKRTAEKDIPLVFRIAKPHEVSSWKDARGKEHKMMVKSRQLVDEIGLDMKISDVELRADQKKATFHYIADGRVDFRELIKTYRREFGLIIEMHQIGARQEAGMVGGIGSCGRELCCSSWRTDFDSVSSSAARKQDLPESSQRLLGKCGKLKCCLMYELDQYEEAWKDIPADVIQLDMAKGFAKKEKVDIMKRIIWYSYPEESGNSFIPVPLDRVKEIIALNKRGIKAEGLLADTPKSPNEKYTDILGSIEDAQKSIKKTIRTKKRNNSRKPNQPKSQAQGQKPRQNQEQPGNPPKKRRNFRRKKNPGNNSQGNKA